MVLRRLLILFVVYAAVAVALLIASGRFKQQLYASIWVEKTGEVFEVFRGEGPMGNVSRTTLADNVAAFVKSDRPEQMVIMKLTDDTVSVATRHAETRWAAKNYADLDAVVKAHRGLKLDLIADSWRKPRLFSGQGSAPTLLVMATATAVFFGIKIIRRGKALRKVETPL